MAAYAALVSLMQILDQIENHPSPPISLDKKQVESLTKIVVFLQEFLEGYKSPFAEGDEADPLEMRIADVVHKAEDVIESHIVDQQLPAGSALYLYESLIKVIGHMDLIKKKVMEMVALEDQLERQVSASLTFSDLYEHVMKLIEHMDWIKKEVLDMVAVKYQLQRLLSASADLNERLMKVVEDIDLIKNEVILSEIIAKLRRRGVSVSADLYKSLIKVVEDMDLIKNEMMRLEIIAKLRRGGVSTSGSSTFAYLYGIMMMLTEYMDLFKKEVMEVIAFKDQLQKKVYPSADLYDNLVNVIKDMELIKKKVMDHNAVEDQLQRQVSPSGSSTSGSSTSSLARLNNTTKVDDVMLQLMDKLTDGQLGRQVIPVVGMGGIGKTTLATNVYQKPLISLHFDIRVWVTISHQYNTKELLCEILSQANKQGKERLSQMKEDEIGLSLHKYLSYRRYLIVLDDIWNIEAWENMKLYLPDNCNGSRIMVTTRLSNLGSQLNSNYGLEMKFMDKESSWDLFCKIVFGGKNCPLELVEMGMDIVEICGGLPLSIVVIGGLLEKLERTKECWESISSNINSLVKSEKYKYCLKILKLSYSHLPVYLKPCFLYLGTFVWNSKIRVSTIINLWVSEGFLKPIRGKSLETVAKEYLDELVDRNLIAVREFGKTGNMKYLKMHDMLRDLCLIEAKKEWFYHMVRRAPNNSRIYTNGARFTSEKMLNIRLLHNCHDPYITDLSWSLQTLIGSNQGIYSDTTVNIWNMSQLRHVCFYVVQLEHLLDPPSESIVIMENLQTLKGVMNFQCDEIMLYRIPNIKKLGLIYNRMESRDDDYCVHNIKHLQKLESLSCVGCPSGGFLLKLSFPHSLKSLTLEMAEGRMEDILERVSTLPLLQKLKLSYGDFTTGKWETIEDQFCSLKYLSLDSCYGLEWWMVESSSHFPCLKHLHLSFLKDLKEIPAELGEIPTLESMALEYCTESAVKSAKRMAEEQEELQGELSFKVAVRLQKKNEELQRLANPNFQVTVS